MAEVDGNHILYHYLQKDLQRVDFPFFVQTALRFAIDLGVWIHPDNYRSLPIVEPVCVRDPSITTAQRLTWGNPQPHTGLMMDDNSMVKSIVKGSSKLIESSRISEYDGKSLGNGFVASHVWREVGVQRTLSNRDNRLFTFIPNLVWLPVQVSKLSDREGSIVQSVLQQLAAHIYRNQTLNAPLQRIIDSCWAEIEAHTHPFALPLESLPEIEKLSFIRLPSRYIDMKKKKIEKASTALLAHAAGNSIPTGRILSSKYDHLIPRINRKAASSLGTWLADYHASLP